jgi:ornithine decarboxylase
MQHASTSPFYPLFASLDVGAQMMKGRSGEVLWDDTIRLGIELRKKLRALKHEYDRSEDDLSRRWFFDPFVPDVVQWQGRTQRWEDVPTDTLASDPRYWQLAPGAAWHGFDVPAAGYAMTDPNKLTLLTPGFDRATGTYTREGVPAAIVAQFLRECGIVPEKNDFNSLLFLLTPGLESSKAGTLLSALVRFKTLYDENAPLEQALPVFANTYRGRYRDVRLRDLCTQMHGFYREHQISRLQGESFADAHLPEVVMSPQEAMQELVRNNVELVPVSEARGRVAATLALVYPPGIGLVVPGERFDERAQPMLDYFLAIEEAGNRFPGFENEIQGIYREVEADSRVRLYTYVIHA